MHPQLNALAKELVEARRRAHAVAQGLSLDDWSLRPEPERWSVAEQILHLNLASGAYLPVIDEAIGRGEAEGAFGGGPYRRDFLGWMLARLVEPPVRLRIRTSARFEPDGVSPRALADEVLRDFDRWQDLLITALYRADGLALDRIEVASPYDPRLQMNLYSFLCTVPAHQRRHLWLAERTRMILAQADALEVAL